MHTGVLIFDFSHTPSGPKSNHSCIIVLEPLGLTSTARAAAQEKYSTAHMALALEGGEGDDAQGRQMVSDEAPFRSAESLVVD